MFEPVLVVDPAVVVVERVAHADDLLAPQLSVEVLDLLQLCVEGCCLRRERHERRVLGFERGHDRYKRRVGDVNRQEPRSRRTLWCMLRLSRRSKLALDVLKESTIC